MASPLLIQYGLPFLVQILGEALQKIDSPIARSATESLEKVQDALSGGQIPPEQLAEANRHAEALAMMQAEEGKAAYTQVNESLRAEIASNDAYVRRMRPTFGYLMALTWAAQMTALSYVITFRTDQAHLVLKAMESLGTIWAVGLSVLGIYVYKRSEEKKSVAGDVPVPKIKPPVLPGRRKLND